VGSGEIRGIREMREIREIIPDFSRDLENLTSISLSYKEEPLRWAAMPT
jgi:hypothetical protein